MKKIMISVIGGHKCSENTAELAFKVGQIIAEEQCVLVCGGRKGVMEAACKGAKQSNGMTIGVLPSVDGNDANEYVDIPIRTGLGFARNSIVANTSDMVVALPGSVGTLSEIAFALTFKRKVLAFGDWDVEGVEKIVDVEKLREHIKKIKA